jgi:hypothetical protein
MFLEFKEPGEHGLINRELRLFACACTRYVGDWIEDVRSWQAVDVAERYADGNASRDELSAAYAAARLAEGSIRERIQQINSAKQASGGGVAAEEWEEWRRFEIEDCHPEGRLLNAARAASFCADVRVLGRAVDRGPTVCADWYFARATALFAYRAGASRERLESMEVASPAKDANHLMYEDRWQADLVRCIFRSPFRPIANDEPDLPPRIREIAESIYRLRAFDRMPELGKDLEAGACVGPDLLSHCLHAHVHTRGCRALDTARGFNRDY